MSETNLWNNTNQRIYLSWIEHFGAHCARRCTSYICFVYGVTKLKQMWCQINPEKNRFSSIYHVLELVRTRACCESPSLCWVILFGHAYLLQIHESNCRFFIPLVFVTIVRVRCHTINVIKQTMFSPKKKETNDTNETNRKPNQANFHLRMLREPLPIA